MALYRVFSSVMYVHKISHNHRQRYGTSIGGGINIPRGVAKIRLGHQLVGLDCYLGYFGEIMFRSRGGGRREGGSGAGEQSHGSHFLLGGKLKIRQNLV